VFRRFFSELKQRNVVRVATVYTVTAWGVFQIVKTVFETLKVPAWASVLVLVLLAIGLPIAIIIAWAFERGPDGQIRRTEAADAEAPPKRFSAVDIALLTATIAVLGVSALQLAGVGAKPVIEKATVIGAGAPVKSVAVLPFVSFSEAKDSEYFADGLTEEVINSLAQVPDLKVAGRTSAFYFKGKNEDIREIGRRLGVAHVVEGSVRREGDKLRVTTQLIDVKTGFHIWSKVYDRNLDDAFAIQTEIAGAVADALKTKLMMSATSVTASRDPQAYRQMLIARAQLRALGLESLTAARATYASLMKQTPNDADAYAGYASTTILLAQNYLTIDFHEARTESEAAIAKALALNPKSANAYIAKGLLCRVLVIRDDDQACVLGAEVAFKRAADLAPRNPDALTFYGDAIAVRRPRDGIEQLQKALALDPLNRIALNGLAGAYARIDRFPEAEKQYLANISVYPEYIDAKQELADLYVNRGMLDRAEPWLRASAAPGTDPSAAVQLANLYFNLGLDARANAVLGSIKQPPVAKNVASAIRLIMRRDYPAFLAYSQARFAEDQDPIWRSGMASGYMLAGRYELARTQILATVPQLMQATPEVSGSLGEEAVLAAFVADRLGDKGQARRIAQGLLDATAPRPNERRTGGTARVLRAKAYAVIGDREHALDELDAAYAAGYRQMVDMEMFLRVDLSPVFADIAEDPRFKAWVVRTQADNARMGKLVSASAQ
jgi:TolB-like protein/tetratricopeptide (TPR) repeat protein